MEVSRKARSSHSWWNFPGIRTHQGPGASSNGCVEHQVDIEARKCRLYVSESVGSGTKSAVRWVFMGASGADNISVISSDLCTILVEDMSMYSVREVHDDNT